MNTLLRLSRNSPITNVILKKQYQYQYQYQYKSNKLNGFSLLNQLSTTSSNNDKDNKSKPPSSSKSLIITNIPGIALSSVTAASGFVLADQLGKALLIYQGVDPTLCGSPISGIPIAILLGIAANNLLPKIINGNSIFSSGLKFSSTSILRTGIVCVGLKLSLLDILSTGSSGLPVVISAMAAGLIYIPWASKLAGLPPRLASLLAAGTSICGVTAITALSPSINATNRETSVAVANVVAFGTLGMLVYPYLLHSFANVLPSSQIGVLLGVSIHDTSQVLGAAMTYKEVYGDEIVMKVAAITKLTRNLGLAAVIPTLTFMSLKEQQKTIDNEVISSSSSDSIISNKSTESVTSISGLATFQKYVPSFLVAFIGMSAFRTIGDSSILASGLAFNIIDPVQYKYLLHVIGDDISKYALGTAMASVGLSTSLKTFEGVGMKPFLVGGSGAAVVGGTAVIVSSLVM